MTITVKNDRVALVVPPSVRRRAGIKAGDRLEFRVTRRTITIVAKPGDSANEYTPAQRRVIDREIARGLEDAKKGRTHGPFQTADEAIAYLKAYTKKRKRLAKAAE